MRKQRLWIAIVFVAAGCRPVLAQEKSSPADMVLHHGKVITVDGNFSVAEAVAVRNGEIVAVGKNDVVVALAGPATLSIDLKGKTVIPGLIDTHSHIHEYARSNYGRDLSAQQLREYPINFKTVQSKDDVLQQIRDIMSAFRPKPGEWVHFSSTGLTQEAQVKILYDDVTRWELDKVTPDNPVALSMGIPIENGYLVNSKAIEILWNKYGDFIEKYGRYWVDGQGRPDGHLEPPANRFVMNEFKPRPAAEDLAGIYRKTLDEWAAMGVTTVSTKLPQASVGAYQLLESRGDLKVRIAYGADWVFGAADPDKAFQGIRMGAGSDKVWIVSLTPVGVDGSGARQCTDLKRSAKESGESGTMGLALLSDWYPRGQCHMDIEYRGPMGRGAPIRGNYFKEYLSRLAAHDLRFANTHVAGDGSQSRLLSTLEEINKTTSLAGKRWALDHCTLVNPEDIPRAAKLGVMWSCAPKYIASAATLAKAYGEEVANRFVVPVKSMLDAGVKVAFEMDQDGYIWKDLQLLLTREVNGKVWGPQERIDRVAALRMITSTAAEYVLREEKLGSLEPGKTADLVVLDRDYMSIPEKEIAEIQPLMTLLGGKAVFVHPDFARQHGLRPEGAVIASYEELRTRHTR